MKNTTRKKKNPPLEPQFPAHPAVCVPRQVTARLSDIHTLPLRRMYGNGARFLQENYSSWIQRHGGYVRKKKKTSCLRSSKHCLRWAAFIPTCPSFWQEEAFHSDDEDDEDQWAEEKGQCSSVTPPAAVRWYLPPLVLLGSHETELDPFGARASCYDTSASHEWGVWTWNEQNRTQDIWQFILLLLFTCTSQPKCSHRINLCQSANCLR